LRYVKEAIAAWLETEQDKAEREGAAGEIEFVRV
jgi:hypothetical protein